MMQHRSSVISDDLMELLEQHTNAVVIRRHCLKLDGHCLKFVRVPTPRSYDSVTIECDRALTHAAPPVDGQP
jgi:hypothetical protein